MNGESYPRNDYCGCMLPTGLACEVLIEKQNPLQYCVDCRSRRARASREKENRHARQKRARNKRARRL